MNSNYNNHGNPTIYTSAGHQQQPYNPSSQQSQVSFDYKIKSFMIIILIFNQLLLFMLNKFHILFYKIYIKTQSYSIYL